MKTFVIPQSYPGRLAIATRPRGYDWLETDALQLARGGWSVLVSALEPAEGHDLGLMHEQSMAVQCGMTYVSFPVPDRSTPAVVRTKAFVETMRIQLVKGSNVAVHCRMGIGRSGLLCAATTVAFGEQPEAAWAILTEVRGLSVPDTDEQKRWLDVFYRACQKQ